MADPETPCCDNNHENIAMVRVWRDPRGNAVYQCPSCGRKVQLRNDGREY